MRNTTAALAALALGATLAIGAAKPSMAQTASAGYGTSDYSVIFVRGGGGGPGGGGGGHGGGGGGHGFGGGGGGHGFGGGFGGGGLGGGHGFGGGFGGLGGGHGFGGGLGGSLGGGRAFGGGLAFGGSHDFGGGVRLGGTRRFGGRYDGDASELGVGKLYRGGHIGVHGFHLHHHYGYGAGYAYLTDPGDDWDDGYVPPADDTVTSCEMRHHSYDPATRTYLGYDGRRHPCP